jgi:hypothetical protein
MGSMMSGTDSGVDFRNRPVLVTGVPRSGTSLIMGSLAASGLWVGHTVPANSDNPKGYFENLRLRERVNKQILQGCGCDPLGIRCLPTLESLPNVNRLRESVLEAIGTEGYDRSEPWGFKEPKLALIWPLWRLHFPGARWVIVRRPLEDVVQSCLRTSFLRQHSSTTTFWHSLVQAYHERLNALLTSGAWCQEISSSEVVAGDFHALAGLIGDLGLDYDENRIKNFINPEAWNRSTKFTPR